jgi:cyanate permease
MVITLVSSLGYFAYNSFLSPYLRQSGVSVIFVGLFFSLVSAVETPMAFAGGVLADRLGSG